MVFRLKYCIVALSTLAMAACSGSYGDYDEYGYGDGYGYAGGNGYGDANMYANYGQAGYGMGGMGGMGMNCMSSAGYGGMGYGGGYTQSGLRTGRYGNPVVATGNVEFYGKKSRYGSYQQSSAGNAGCTSGYWTIPTYQVVQQPPAVMTPAPAPVVTTTVQQSCPDGQYRMDNGDCAIMINEETEQYVPPVTSYPTVTAPTVDWYEPVRK